MYEEMGYQPFSPEIMGSGFPQQYRPPSITSTAGLLQMRSNHSSWAPEGSYELRSANASGAQAPLISHETDRVGRRHKNRHHDTRYQLLRMLGKGAARWGITLLLCGLFILVMYHYRAKSIINENEKRRFNTWTVGLSILMGLNVASSFKEMAMNIRWWLLSRGRYNLNQMDLILRCESMQCLTRMLFTIRQRTIIVFCLVFLLLNIASQAGIAMISLTYGIERNMERALSVPGNVSTANMGSFKAWSNSVNNDVTEESLAHLYGIASPLYGFDDTGTYTPDVGRTALSDTTPIWLSSDGNTWTYGFYDAYPLADTQGLPPTTVRSNRLINSSWSCEQHFVLSNGDGSKTQFSVKDLGLQNVTLAKPNATTFYTRQGSTCKDPTNKRCAVVEAFEASFTEPYYYRCEITISEVSNVDPVPAQSVGDHMAVIAAMSIALQGKTTVTPDDPHGPQQEAQLFYNGEPWGGPFEGNEAYIGRIISFFAIGSITGASFSNPRTFYNGNQPVDGNILNFNKETNFYVIIGLICVGQLVLFVGTSVLADRVRALPESYIAAAAILNPIAQHMKSNAGEYARKEWINEGKKVSIQYVYVHDSGGWEIKDMRNTDTAPIGSG